MYNTKMLIRSNTGGRWNHRVRTLEETTVDVNRIYKILLHPTNLLAHDLNKQTMKIKGTVS